MYTINGITIIQETATGIILLQEETTKEEILFPTTVTTEAKSVTQIEIQIIPLIDNL
jgi:hypothetical protein